MVTFERVHPKQEFNKQNKTENNWSHTHPALTYAFVLPLASHRAKVCLKHKI